MIWTREQAEGLVKRALAFSKADEARANLTGGDRANVRFARNTVTTSGASTGYSLALTARIGKKSGVVTTNQFDDRSLERTMRNAEEIARLSPENPEAMPELPRQPYNAVKAFFEDVANTTATWRADSVSEAIALSKERGVVSAGFIETAESINAVGNTKGVLGYHTSTSAEYNLTARTVDETGSGWASRSYNELRLLNTKSLATAAIDKAVRSKNPVAIEPGKYTVVLEPAAVADLLAFLVFFAGARQADEGRSYFSKKGGGNRIGERILSERVSIYSDPADPLAPGAPFDDEGMPVRRIDWIEKGLLTSLLYSRFWAEKQEKPPMGSPNNVAMAGGAATIEELIKSTDRGVLVTRFWYIRPLEPQNLVLTGLTRDGLFLIEKGAVTLPVRNMRWNESPVAAFSNIEDMTPAERIVSGEGIGSGGLAVVCPAARITQFTFSSASDAV